MVLEDTAYATYDNFLIGDEDASYKLLLGDYEGTTGDSLTYQTTLACCSLQKIGIMINLAQLTVLKQRWLVV